MLVSGGALKTTQVRLCDGAMLKLPVGSVIDAHENRWLIDFSAPTTFHPTILSVLVAIHIYNILPKTNIDPDNGPMEDDLPLPTRGFQVPC